MLLPSGGCSLPRRTAHRRTQIPLLCSTVCSCTTILILIHAFVLRASLTSGRGAAKGKLLPEARRTRGEAKDSPHAVRQEKSPTGKGTCAYILVGAVELGHDCATPATVLSGQVLTSVSTLCFIGWEWVSLSVGFRAIVSCPTMQDTVKLSRLDMSH